MIESKDYIKLVTWSDEDRCFLGSCPNLIEGPACHGDNETEVYAELCVIVDEWIETIKSDGKPLPKPAAGKTFSGKFNLRLSPAHHEQLYLQSLAHNLSLNSYCEEKLSL